MDEISNTFADYLKARAAFSARYSAWCQHLAQWQAKHGLLSAQLCSLLEHDPPRELLEYAESNDFIARYLCLAGAPGWGTTPGLSLAERNALQSVHKKIVQGERERIVRLLTAPEPAGSLWPEDIGKK